MRRWLLVIGALGFAASVGAEKVPDVRATKHNLSATGPGAVRAQSETQVCVFCHTPHGASASDVSGVGLRAPLWNRSVPAGSTYTPYTSASLDATAIQGSLDQPGGSSKLCLSCHDGTIAVGNVNVLNGAGASPGGITIPMQNVGGGGEMPPGAGAATGFTRNLGVDLRNDHPISVSYTAALAQRDAELRPVDATQKWPPGSGTEIGVRTPGYKPKLPLEPTGAQNLGQVQCATCHDPHIHENDVSKGNQKFLRANRFQESAPSSTLNSAGDIFCLTCHDKNLAGGSWAHSAHANPQVATQIYTAAAAAQREFPANLPVWRAACMNCHDTHTVAGARRLAREGTDSLTVPKSGGNSAIEETCYQCHTSLAETIVTPATQVPDIKADFLLPRRMPISNLDQASGTEVHDIGSSFSDGGFIDCTGPSNGCGKDFLEARALLGSGNLSNRHAECTDCHNPHRVVKLRSFAGVGGVISSAPDPAGTHAHTDTLAFTHTNVASGVLRGAFGVEPNYGATSFHSLPTSYTVKRGDPGISADTTVSASHVTREYQICLKCHSDYGYSDNNAYPTGNRPSLGQPGGTPSGTNDLVQYTNQAKEFQAPLTHRAEPAGMIGGGAAPAFEGGTHFNHRSWHPVIEATGRSLAVRGGADAQGWNLPWRNAIGTQTMYCSDCHGSGVSAANSVTPDGGENGNPWGPHGSVNDFILKGDWNSLTGTGQQGSGLCFKCHNYSVYATRAEVRTGFYNDPNDRDRGDLHSFHADKIGRLRCTWCHVAVPHGWKNKALLVNLNDVGPEAGLAPGTQVRNNTSAGYTQGPYYVNAMLKIRNFARSGLWREADCGSAGAPGNGESGRDWMRDSSENCANPP